MWPPVGSPLKSKLMSMYFPKRLELSLRLVLALPKASKTQLDLSRMFLTLRRDEGQEEGEASLREPERSHGWTAGLWVKVGPWVQIPPATTTRPGHMPWA